MKGVKNAKVPFGTEKYSPIKHVRYVSWKDAFDVEFADGLCILEPHSTVRAANKISLNAKFDRIEIEDWTRSGFLVHYDNGQIAEVSWSFIRERPPRRNSRSLLDDMEAIVIAAIKNKRVLSFFYDRTPRVVEPQTYGISTAGHPVLRGYQVTGGSKSGRTTGLRLYELAKMEGLRDTGIRFAQAQPQHQRKDSAMSRVIISLPMPKAA